MILDFEKLDIYIRPGITDMRKAVNGLSVTVKEQMNVDPFSESLFIFCNRERRILKALYWDRNGFCLWQKRLERHRYPWPMTKEDVLKLEYEQLKMLLSGIDFFKAHERLNYKKIS
jgi:transposase